MFKYLFSKYMLLDRKIIMVEQLLSPSFITMIIIVYFAGIIRGYSGFGSALFAIPALAIIFGPVQAVAIEILIEIPVSIGLLPMAMKSAKKETILPMLIAFILFVPVGTLLLVLINPNILKIIISLFVLVAVLVISQQSKITSLFSTKASFIVGAISGVTQGLAGMAGPFFAIAILARDESSTITRANITMLSAAIICISVISFFIFGLINYQTIFYALLASPAILLGAWTGSVLFHKYSYKNFKTIILYLLTFSALFTLFETIYM
jgi:uncharacterized membrane protein YfcA